MTRIARARLTLTIVSDTVRGMDIERPASRFEQIYNRRPTLLVQAPGRVNLIGEHTDYNEGFVLPIAIERQVAGALAPRSDRKVTFTSLQVDPPAEIDLDAPITPGEPQWANYCKGVAYGLIERGVPLRGTDILLDSDIPIGSGLSSSAALEVCTGMALLAGCEHIGAVGDRDLALLCQRAENEFANAPCGIMDQTISVMGQPGRALLLDCRDGSIQQIPFDDPGMVLLVADTQVRHEIGGGEYGRRRQCCAEVGRKLGIRALRDTDGAAIDSARRNGILNAVEAKRAKHVVSEIARTLAGVDALKGGDYARFGRLMYESHASLRDDYEVSCDELDAIVESSGRIDVVFGARMTGGGFGGSAIILASRDGSQEIIEAIGTGYRERFGRSCSIFSTRAAAGAGLIGK